MNDFTNEEIEIMRDSMLSMLDICDEDQKDFYQGIVDKLNKLLE